MKQKFSITLLLLICSLAFSLFFPLVSASVDVKQNVVFRTRDNNARFTMGADFTFFRTEVNSSHLFLDRSYSTKHYTRYCIFVNSPNDVQLTVNTWFATANSTATLTITSPTSTNISVSAYSPNFIVASASNVVSQTWTAGNLTLSMIVNTDTSSTFTISATVNETAYNNTPENMQIERTNIGLTQYIFQATYWDVNGYGDLDTMMIAVSDGSTWANASYNQAANTFSLLSGSSITALSTGTTSVVDSNVLAVNFIYVPSTTFLNVFSITMYLWVNDTSGASDGWESRTVRINYAPQNIQVSITDMDAGNVLVAETGYYSFQAEYRDLDGTSDLDTMMVAFTDGQTWVNASYDGSTWSLVSGSNVSRVQDGTTSTLSSTNLQVTFSIYLTESILDALDVEIYMWVNDTASASDGWEVMQTDYFDIYNLGGASTLETSGTAGRIDGGDVFELYAESASSVQANMTFRRLQHVHMLYHIWVANQRTWDDWETDNISIEMGIDYYSSVDDAWLTGWSVYLEQFEGWLDASTMRLQWNVTWNYRGSQIWSSTMNSFPLTNETGDSGIPAQTSFITDLWFNKVNASSTVGGRITSEYYAMRDNANPWLRWATGSAWGVDVGNVTQAMFFQDLLDSSGDIISVKQVEMMRVWVNLTQASNSQNVRVEIRDFDLFNIVTKPTGEMEGIDTPIFVATKTPDMPQGGFLNALWAAIQAGFNAIANALGPAVLNFWNTFVNFVDSIGAYFGVPGFFSLLLSWMNSFWAWVLSSISYLISLLTSVFLFFAATMGKFVSVVSQIITQWIATVNTLVNFLDGAYTSGINVWNDLGMTTWLTLAAILYPLYLVVVWDEQGTDAVINQLRFIVDVIYMIVHTLIVIVQNVVAFVSYVVEAIPIVE